MAPPKVPVDKPYQKMTAAELEDAVRYHNYLYFTENNPVISDYDFDRMVRRLEKLQPEAGVLQEIPSEGETRSKVKHLQPMLSLEKAYSAAEVQKWAGKFEGSLMVSPKIDGLALEIRYDKDGQLILAATRGNGIQGELITDNVRMIADIPQQVPQGPVEVRGEIYMKLSIFRRHYADQFANPRNLAAGALKQKDPSKTKEYRLSFFAYGLKGTAHQSEWEKFQELKKWEFPIVELKKIDRDIIEETYQYFLSRREEYDYETDGVVFMADDVAVQEELGSTAHHPRWSIAYKYQGDSGVTTLHDVEWSVARSGAITPIGIVEPVALSGAMVSRVSLHNYGQMMEKKLKRGAQVVMVRRGGVIPYLEAVEKAGRGKLFKAPERCPSCGSPTEVRDEFLYCTNAKGCSQTKIAELEHFIKTVEIDGFGPKLVTKLYDNELVTEPADFYDLTKEALLDLERMGDKLATKLIRNIQDKRFLDLETFLACLGIREVGRQVARVLSERFGTFEAVRTASAEDLTSVDMVGPVIAEELSGGLKAREESIARLLAHVSIKKTEVTEMTGKLAGKKICFTGSLAGMSRSDGQKKVKALGGIATSSVTKDLDYLVVGSEGKAGSKLTKAEKLVQSGADLKIIQEDDFLKLIGA